MIVFWIVLSVIELLVIIAGVIFFIIEGKNKKL